MGAAIGTTSAAVCCNQQQPSFPQRRVYSENSPPEASRLPVFAMEKVQTERSKLIDNELRREAEANLKSLKVLLLGASDSGKSTVAKQMRILHTEGFSTGERIHYKYMVHSNFIDLFGHIAKGIYKLQIPVPPEEREMVEMFADSYYGQFLGLGDGDELVELALKFLRFASVQSACQSLTAFYTPDNTEYLLTHAERILRPEYVPITDDIIHARVSTKGIYEIIFGFREFTIRLIDVGGQRTERRKWIHCFEGVSAILFIVSLSCYNLQMEEDAKVNQLADTIELFKTIYRNKFLRSSSFMMFLNKTDIFAKKLRYEPLQKYQMAFEGKITADMDEGAIYTAALDYVKSMFMVIRGHDKRPIYVHPTCATDTKNIDFVFNATCDIVISNNIKTAGMG